MGHLDWKVTCFLMFIKYLRWFNSERLLFYYLFLDFEEQTRTSQEPFAGLTLLRLGTWHRPGGITDSDTSVTLLTHFTPSSRQSSFLCFHGDLKRCSAMPWQQQILWNKNWAPCCAYTCVCVCVHYNTALLLAFLMVNGNHEADSVALLLNKLNIHLFQ